MARLSLKGSLPGSLTSSIKRRWATVIVFIASVLPFVILRLSPASPQTALRSTGDWSLIFLAITLAITPLRRLFGFPSLIRFRRMFGLFAFFYACMHACSDLSAASPERGSP